MEKIEGTWVELKNGKFQILGLPARPARRAMPARPARPATMLGPPGPARLPFFETSARPARPVKTKSAHFDVAANFNRIFAISSNARPIFW